MNSDSLGARLRTARKSLGLNQDEVALACGVSREMWGKYERDVSVPGSAVLMALVANGADGNFLLGGATNSAPLSSDERELLALFRAASLGVKAAAIGALQGGLSGGVQQHGLTLNNNSPGGVQVGYVAGKSTVIHKSRK